MNTRISVLEIGKKSYFHAMKAGVLKIIAGPGIRSESETTIGLSVVSVTPIPEEVQEEVVYRGKLSTVIFQSESLLVLCRESKEVLIDLRYSARSDRRLSYKQHWAAMNPRQTTHVSEEPLEGEHIPSDHH